MIAMAMMWEVYKLYKKINLCHFAGTTMVDGLWGSDPLVTDFAAVVLRQKLLGATLPPPSPSAPRATLTRMNTLTSHQYCMVDFRVPSRNPCVQSSSGVQFTDGKQAVHAYCWNAEVAADL